MLRYSFATFEGCNLLWHIVAPPPPSTPLFLFFSLVHPIWYFAGCLLRGVIKTWWLANFVWALSFKQKKGGCGRSLFPQSTLILNLRGLFEENPILKNCGTTLERGRNLTWGDKVESCKLKFTKNEFLIFTNRKKASQDDQKRWPNWTLSYDRISISARKF